MLLLLLLITYHLSFIIYHLSFIIYHLSFIIYHLSFIIYHLSFIIYHLSFIIYHLSFITYHLSLITYHLSLITYHLSLITYHLSLITLIPSLIISSLYLSYFLTFPSLLPPLSFNRFRTSVNYRPAEVLKEVFLLSPSPSFPYLLLIYILPLYPPHSLFHLSRVFMSVLSPPNIKERPKLSLFCALLLVNFFILSSKGKRKEKKERRGEGKGEGF